MGGLDAPGAPVPQLHLVASIPDLAEELRRIGREGGLDAVGICDARPFTEARTVLEQRKALGWAAGMQFTYRNPARSTDPDRTLPGATAIVVGARRYLRAAAPTAGPTAGPTADARRSDRPSDRPESPARPAGRVARYSWVDHYQPLRAALGRVADHLVEHGWRARMLVDDNALVDRAAAVRAGIGWYGKNSNVLVPGAGSWFVLGSVLTDAPLVPRGRPPSRRGRCGPCRRCLTACPTGALVGPGELDARRCLAWLVQAPGVFPLEYREALGDRLYGCDDCQEVCPVNKLGARLDPPGPPEPGAQPAADLLDLLDADDAALLAHFGRWYIPQSRAALPAAQRPPGPRQHGRPRRPPDGPRPREGARQRGPDHPGPRRVGRGAPGPAGPARAAAGATGPRSDRARRRPSTPWSPPWPPPRRHPPPRRRCPPPAGPAPSPPGPALLPRAVDPPPSGHQRLPPQDRWHPVLPLGVLAPPSARRRHRAHQPVPRRGRLRPRPAVPDRAHPGAGPPAEPAPGPQDPRLAAEVGAKRWCSTRPLPLGMIGPGLGLPYAAILHGSEVTVPGRLPGSRKLLARVLTGASLLIAAGGYPEAEARRVVGDLPPDRAGAAGGGHHPVRPLAGDRAGERPGPPGPPRGRSPRPQREPAGAAQGHGHADQGGRPPEGRASTRA